MNTRNAARAYIAIVLAIVGVLGLHVAGQRVLEQDGDPFGIKGRVVSAVVAVYNRTSLEESSARASSAEASKTRSPPSSALFRILAAE